MSKVYIQIDDSNHIINVNSDIFLTYFDGWICIDEGEGDKYALAFSNYFEKPIFNEYGVEFSNISCARQTEASEVIEI